MRENFKKKKTALGVSAAVLTVAMILTGTFAWQSISQKAMNEKIVDQNAGGRIHDDWNGQNKDVYAENYMSSEEGGTKVFVRVRLMEFMETGKDAGGDPNQSGRDAVSLVDGAKAGETSSWRIRKPGETEAENPFLTYWNWKMGEGTTTVYMPTFNKNKDSLAVDVNGTYEASDGNKDHYADYVEWKLNDETEGVGVKTADEYYDADTNGDDEDTTHTNGNGGKEGENYTVKKSQKHQAATTGKTEKIMTMNEWEEAGSPVGKYWVWDSDGWFYWAEPLYPGETTGLLLDEVQQKKYMTGNNYYGINVMGQFATAEQWGEDGETKTGFYADHLSENALALLNQAAKIVRGADQAQYLDCGNNTYQKIGSDGTPGELMCAGADQIVGNEDDVFNVLLLENDLVVNGVNYGRVFLEPNSTGRGATGELGNVDTYYSVGEDEMLGTADDVKLWYGGEKFPEASDDTYFSTLGKVKGEDGAKYLVCGSSVYRKVVSGSAPTLVCAGADGKIGTEDDKTNVVVLESDLIIGRGTEDEVNYGKMFLKPDSSISAYRTVGEDGKLGTEDDVKFWYYGDNFPEGGDNFFSKVALKWQEQIAEYIEEGSTGTDYTITIDGEEFYVLVKDSENNRALLLTKYVQCKKNDAGNDPTWKNSAFRTYINSTASDGWLYEKTELQKALISTNFQTLTSWSAAQTSVYTLSDKVFLLQGYDVEETTLQNNDLYTWSGGTLKAPAGSWIAYDKKGVESTWWLRTPMTYTNGLGFVAQTGMITCTDPLIPEGIRPAMWVEF